MSKKIGLICGSLRANSYNRIVGEAVAALDVPAEFHWIDIGNLPLFNEDLEGDNLPKSVAVFNNAVRQSDGILIVSPEYNSGMSGALKNALDWASRPPRSSVIHRKPVGLIGATPGGLGTAFSQRQIRQTLDAVQALVLPFQKVLISQVHEKIDAEQRVLTDEKTKQYVQRYVLQLINWIDNVPVLD
ncbi:NADPH-dependent FMN reductase [Paenibacillus sp. 481]|uniref:NADPH-dependent FMN reductase n=1 Tax=Paenibacillus sp. 481 TaxID=2835869 RepID=UPI001E378A48|nr:NADPH-dependent FMN reductase [Paenibacillus sp. 481]UHA71989.1 NAD(P)H-dependent oxidoreductase [Paenibacillus sp. 481]